MGQIVGAGLGLIGGVIQGVSAQAQGTARAAEIQRDAELARISATESMAGRLEDLQRTVGTIRAMSGQRGIDANDPSSLAAIADAQRFADRDVQRTAFNAQQNYSNAQLAARAAKASGTAAMYGTFLNAGGGFIKAADDYFSKAT